MIKVRVTEGDLEQAVYNDTYPSFLALGRVLGVDWFDILIDRDGIITLRRSDDGEGKSFLIKDYDNLSAYMANWDLFIENNQPLDGFIGFQFSLKKK